MKEVWKSVPGFPFYEVSDLGRVRSVDRVVDYIRNGITISRNHKGVLLAPGTVSSGHQLVMLGRGNPKLVHALVLIAFVGPRPDRYDGRHMDGDPANNVLTNLKWGTRSENIQDAVRHGTARFEEKHPNAKLTREKVSDIKAMLKTHTAYRISKIVGMSHGAIQMIESGRTWKTVEAAQ